MKFLSYVFLMLCLRSDEHANILMVKWCWICNICVICCFNCYSITVCRILSVLDFTESKTEVWKPSYGEKLIILHSAVVTGVTDLCDGPTAVESNKLSGARSNRHWVERAVRRQLGDAQPSLTRLILIDIIFIIILVFRDSKKLTRSSTSL